MVCLVSCGRWESEVALSPWYRVAVPREDLRERRPLDAAQFAVHLDRVREGNAPPEYVDPARFLGRTYLTEGLRRFGGEVLRRLAGEREGSNAVLNLVTGFGGGKTHALTLLYHLATLGPAAQGLLGVGELLDSARLERMPEPAAVAVFVGTDWDVVAGREADSEALRRTPWGEIAWQLSRQAGDPALFESVREQDEARVRPGKEVIRQFLPIDRPVLILMDEVMNFMTGARGVRVEDSTLASQFYEFVHNLTEEADSRDHLSVVVSLPKSEGEMSAEDEADFNRLENVTKRVATPYVLAKDLEIPEIVRRRLFESTGDEGEIETVATTFAGWVRGHKDLIPGWFPIDRAEEFFRASYPFHPTVLSVFERKWQTLPSFGSTRGILRLLAQWVSITYAEGFTEAREEPLIGLGAAPLDDQFFRAAVLEQLGNDALQGAIVADIAGESAHAERLDEEAPETLRKARIHRQVATTVLFESSGGQIKETASLPEVRLAVGRPGLEVGNIETALEALRTSCYYLGAQAGGYRFSVKPNLNKWIADRRAALDAGEVEAECRSVIAKVFTDKKGVVNLFDVVLFPEDAKSIPDTPSLRLVVMPADQQWDEAISESIRNWMAEHGPSPRQFKNALVWAIPGDSNAVLDAARYALAWRSLAEEADAREFDEDERRELDEHRKRADRDLKEAVWRTYRRLAFLVQDGTIATEDLGLVHSSSAESLQALIQMRLRQGDELTDSLSPNQVVRNWPTALLEWTTKQLRDAVYASPKFTRLSNPSALRETIARGVRDGAFGYGVKTDSDVTRVAIDQQIEAADVEISDEVVLLPEKRARALKEAAEKPEVASQVVVTPEDEPGETAVHSGGGQVPMFTRDTVAGVRWEGEVPAQKWTTFYMKVLARLAQEGDLSLHVRFESRPESGLPADRVSEVRENLEELGLQQGPEVIDEEGSSD
jgi:hypothetical protein